MRFRKNYILALLSLVDNAYDFMLYSQTGLCHTLISRK